MKPLYILALLLCSILSYAQPEDGFSEDPTIFLEELESYLKDTKREELKDAIDLFIENKELRKVTDEQIVEISKTCDLLLKRKMRAWPYFGLYLNAINALSEVHNGTESSEEFTMWNSTLKEVAEVSKGTHKEFESFTEFSYSLFKNNQLYESKGRGWTTYNSKYSFSFREGVPQVEFKVGDLVGFSKQDTIRIFQTEGIYYPFTYDWVGKNGLVNWNRSGKKDISATVTFTDYVLNAKKSEYAVDTVTFKYDEFLKRELKGRFRDKLKTNIANNRDYPEFEGFDLNVELTNIAPQIEYVGGFALKGENIIGRGDSTKRARVKFYDSNDSLAVVALSESFGIKKLKEINSQSAQIVMYFGTDSIYHPKVNLKYRPEDRELRLQRSDSGLGKTGFFDSYHQMEFYTDYVEWKLDQPVINLKMLSTSGTATAVFESANYFEKNRFLKYRNIADYNPLSELKIFSEESNSMEVNATRFAKSINEKYTANTIRGMLYKMVEDGFIFYDQPSETIYIKEKVLMYGKANKDLVDYDFIRINSNDKNVNGQLDLENFDLDMVGVKSVKVSQVKDVVFIPENKFINVKKNRDMKFDGAVIAGKVDFVGSEFDFNYEGFNVKLPTIDRMILTYPTDKRNDTGGAAYEPIKSAIEGVTGSIQIDESNNKSGREAYLDFPKFDSYNDAFVYYDRKDELQNVYNRENFHFKVDPFAMDSLNDLDPYTQSFSGELISDGIFPTFKNKLTIQEDLSLGFETSSPDSGYDLFGPLGSYNGDIGLNNSGLNGAGDFTYIGASLSADEIYFYPDSLNAACDSFYLEKSSGGVSFPETSNNSVYCHWEPKNDSMEIFMEEDPFTIFNSQASLKGDLILSSKGVSGDGFLDWKEASLKSNLFRFQADIATADTSDLTIKTLDTTAVAFVTPDVSAKVDFKEKTGDFKSTQESIPTDLPFNQYVTSMSEFYWDMDKGLIDMILPNDPTNPTFFTSVHKKQEGLKFQAKSGLYDLNSYILKVEGVPHVVAGDSRILPDSNKMVIHPGARIETLENATILTDTINNYHKIINATVNLKSRLEYLAEGDYLYLSEVMDPQTIRFDKIQVETIPIEGKKKAGKKDPMATMAYAAIDEDQGFKIDKVIDYKGDVTLNARKQFLTFNGAAKITLNTDKLDTQWFLFNDEINPNSIQMYVDDMVSESKDTLFVGIGFDMGDLEMYSTFIDRTRTRRDFKFLEAKGFLDYDPKKRVFSVGDPDKILGKKLNGNVYSLYDASNSVVASGKINLGNFPLMNIDAAGIIENDLNENSFTFDKIVLGMDFLFNEDALYAMQRVFKSDNEEGEDVDYLNENFSAGVVELVPPKEAEETVKSIERLGYFDRPKGMDYTMFLSDLTLEWDTTSRSMVSKEKFGLGYLGENYVNRMVDGYVEIIPRRDGNTINIYIETDQDNYFFFTYKRGLMGALSSDTDFNDAVVSEKPTKRTKKDKSGNIYQYGLASKNKLRNFLLIMDHDMENQ